MGISSTSFKKGNNANPNGLGGNRKPKGDKQAIGLRRAMPEEEIQAAEMVVIPPKSKEKKLEELDIVAYERRYAVVCLKRDGYSVPEIADMMSMEPKQVEKDIEFVLKMTRSESGKATEIERALQIERLDQLIKAYTPLAVDHHKEAMVDKFTGQVVIVTKPPDPAYGNLVLSVEARRAKLLALDKPETKKLDITAIRQYVGVDVDDV